jgi:hypothetical protein
MDAVLCATRISGADTVSAHPLDSYCFMFMKINDLYAPVIPIFTEWGYIGNDGGVQECPWSVHESIIPVPLPICG